MCDSSIPGHNEGLLDDWTLKWLDEALGSATGPAFVCFHHPPVRLHQPFVDAIKLQREHDLADVIAQHDNVVAILCGHAHTAAATTFAGVPVLVAPGVKSSLLPAWESDQPVTMDLPPALAFHILDDDRRLTTTTTGSSEPARTRGPAVDRESGARPKTGSGRAGRYAECRHR